MSRLNAVLTSAIGSPPSRGAGDSEPADLGLGADQALVSEELQSLADGGSADVVLGGQRLLPWELLGLPAAATEPFAELLRQAFVRQVGGVGSAGDVTSARAG